MPGFGLQALDFYEDLADDNSRTFWSAHRASYEENVRAPMVELLGALEAEFGSGKVFRPYRDLRYSADKTPYKTHQGAFVQRGPGTGLYVELSAGGLRTGAGFYHASPAELAQFRGAVDDERSGAALERLVAAAICDGWELGGDLLATRPRGTDPQHPRIALLRHRSLVLSRDHGAPAWLHTNEVVERVRADWRAGEALVTWVEEHVHPAGRAGA